MARLTKQQQQAIKDLYARDPNGSKSFLSFRRRVRLCGTVNDLYAAIGWCGMFVGIEKDGYTHT